MRFIRDKYLITVVVITIIVILGMFGLRVSMHKSQTVVTVPETAQSRYGTFRVVQVIDGDTIKLNTGETVRLLGIDTPETQHAEVPVQRFGKEASEFLKQMVEGFECRLEFEPGNVKDKYGRILAYVYVDDRMANAELLRRGYAYVYTRFPFSRMNEFIRYEQEARERQYGLWNFSLRDGRIANIISRYDSLNIEGKQKFDTIIDDLVKKYAQKGR